MANGVTDFEAILERARKMAAGSGTSTVPRNAKGEQTYRAFLEQQNPFQPFQDRLDANLAKVDEIPRPTYYNADNNPLGLPLDDSVGANLLRLALNAGMKGVDLGVRGTGIAAAPLAAAVQSALPESMGGISLGSPSEYEKYLESEIFPQLASMKAQRDRYTGLAEALTAPRSGPVGASGIIAGGPTYAQTATPADQNAALRSQLAAAQAAAEKDGSIYIDERTGQIVGDSTMMRNQMEGNDPLMIGGDTFFPSDDVDAVDYNTVSQFIKENEGTASGDGSGKSGKGVTQESADQTGDPLLMTGTGEQDFSETGSAAGGGQTTQQKKSNLYAGLLKESFDNYNTLLGNAPSGAKTMEEYKKEFSDATGIDITGQPDNSAALTAFGLALMQNKAGKGFDVGELLSETGKAGEKALPLMAQARKEAREAQIAAGQYALGASKEDRLARAKSLDEATKYLVGRRDTILDQQRARIEAMDDFEKQRIATIELETLKAGFDAEIKWQEALAAANEPNFKVGNTKDWEPLGNTMPVKITMGIKEKDGRPVFLYPAEQAETLGQALADVTDGMNSLDSLRDKIIEASRTDAGEFAGISGQKAYEVYQQWAASLGYEAGAVPQFDKDGKYTGNSERQMPVQEADAIRQRLIAQFKRFLTQETGNGISNVDVKNIENLLGQVNFLTDPQGALNRLEEVRAIFQASESKITGALKKFDNRDRYQSPEEYDLARKAISDGINRAFYKKGSISDNVGDSFNFTRDDAGNQVYDFTQ